MARQQNEYPGLGELVLCTVNNIQGTTVFAKLDKYGKTGVIHTSEIAPGRIRNIREYVVPNKKIVCKILRLDPSKGHIDLSLRRVSKKDTQEMLKAFKREQVANKVIDMVLKDKSKEVKEKVLDEYETLTDFLERSLQDQKILSKFMTKTKAEKISKIVAEKIKPKEIFVKTTLKISSLSTEGVSLIKKVLDIKEEGLKITYLGAPNYQLTLKGMDYKKTGKKMREITEKITKTAKKLKVEVIEE